MSTDRPTAAQPWAGHSLSLRTLIVLCLEANLDKYQHTEHAGMVRYFILFLNGQKLCQRLFKIISLKKTLPQIGNSRKCQMTSCTGHLTNLLSLLPDHP